MRLQSFIGCTQDPCRHICALSLVLHIPSASMHVLWMLLACQWKTRIHSHGDLVYEAQNTWGPISLFGTSRCMIVLLVALCMKPQNVSLLWHLANDCSDALTNQEVFPCALMLGQAKKFPFSIAREQSCNHNFEDSFFLFQFFSYLLIRCVPHSIWYSYSTFCILADSSSMCRNGLEVLRFHLFIY